MRLELTKRGDYAIRSVIALAGIAVGARLSVRQMASAQAIPVRFLPQVMADLGRAGLVEAVPGRTGGYRLARPASEMTLLDVVEAVEGDLRRHTCVLRGGACGVDGTCAVHSVFSGAQDDLLDRLARTTVASVASPSDPAQSGGRHRSAMTDAPGATIRRASAVRDPTPAVVDR